MARFVPIKMYVLELTQAPEGERPSHAEVMAYPVAYVKPAYYKDLYTKTGSDLGWVDRALLEEEELMRLLESEQTRLFLLFFQGKAAGFAETLQVEDEEVKIEYFGLIPEFRGLGLGKFFLNWLLHELWQDPVKKIWLTTTEWDHPAALPNYLKSGFELKETKIVQQQVVD